MWRIWWFFWAWRNDFDKATLNCPYCDKRLTNWGGRWMTHAVVKHDRRRHPDARFTLARYKEYIGV